MRIDRRRILAPVAIIVVAGAVAFMTRHAEDDRRARMAAHVESFVAEALADRPVDAFFDPGWEIYRSQLRARIEEISALIQADPEPEGILSVVVERANSSEIGSSGGTHVAMVRSRRVERFGLALRDDGGIIRIVGVVDPVP